MQMSSPRLALSSLITAVVAFGVFVVVRFIQDSQLSATDLVSAAIVGLVTGATTLLLFRKYRQ